MHAIQLIEEEFGFCLPSSHLEAIADPADPIHGCCDFLIGESPYELLRLQHVNNFLHNPAHPDPWPPFLLAFASNGCGDYFAYDVRSTPARIIYIDPDNFVSDNLANPDLWAFPSFEAWRSYMLTSRASVGA